MFSSRSVENDLLVHVIRNARVLGQPISSYRRISELVLQHCGCTLHEKIVEQSAWLFCHSVCLCVFASPQKDTSQILVPGVKLLGTQVS